MVSSAPPIKVSLKNTCGTVTRWESETISPRRTGSLLREISTNGISWDLKAAFTRRQWRQLSIEKIVIRPILFYLLCFLAEMVKSMSLFFFFIRTPVTLLIYRYVVFFSPDLSFPSSPVDPIGTPRPKDPNNCSLHNQPTSWVCSTGRRWSNWWKISSIPQIFWKECNKRAYAGKQESFFCVHNFFLPSNACSVSPQKGTTPSRLQNLSISATKYSSPSIGQSSWGGEHPLKWIDL